MRRWLPLAVFVLIFAASNAYAWTGPTASPPDNNAPAPINVSAAGQVKQGSLGVSGYLNFGATLGSTGYGIRDNAGTLEFKNSGGSWATLQNIIYGYGGGQWTKGPNGIYYNGGNVGVGTANPSYKLDVNGYAQVNYSLVLKNGNGVAHQIFNYPSAANNNPLYLGTGRNVDGTKNGIVLYNLSCDGGCNVPYINLDADQVTVSGYENVSNPTSGQWGLNVSSPSYGIYGHAGAYGVEGQAANYGVYGYATGNGYGVYGYAPSAGAVGVRGDGNAYGVEGYNTQSGIYGILGYGSYGLYSNGNAYATDYYDAAAGMWLSSLRLSQQLSGIFSYDAGSNGGRCPDGSLSVGTTGFWQTYTNAIYYCRWILY